MNGPDTVAEAREAWARIKEHGRKSFDDWICVARALAIGRTAALKAAGTNRAVGSKYNIAAGKWLTDHQLDGITATERYRALRVLEHLDAIELWRAGLDEAKRRTYNSPSATWHAWRRSLKPATPAPQRRHIVERITAAADKSRQGKPVYWSQAALRRAHEGMLKSKSTDLLILARAALENAIRCEGDLLALLNEPKSLPPPPPRPAETPIAASPAHA